MSILIKGMKMPKDCPMCPCAHWNKNDVMTGCEIVLRYIPDSETDYWQSDKRPGWCPLVEVPTPHGPLIDADEIIEVQMFDEMYEEWTLKTMSVAEYLASAADMPPTVIEAEEEAEK